MLGVRKRLTVQPGVTQQSATFVQHCRGEAPPSQALRHGDAMGTFHTDAFVP